MRNLIARAEKQLTALAEEMPEDKYEFAPAAGAFRGVRTFAKQVKHAAAVHLLQWVLGYNFSVAVWVGYIALYGVAVQTGVVMVVYLHEASAGTIRTREWSKRRFASAVPIVRPSRRDDHPIMATLMVGANHVRRLASVGWGHIGSRGIKIAIQ